jgi:hypothetical protein
MPPTWPDSRLSHSVANDRRWPAPARSPPSRSVSPTDALETCVVRRPGRRLACRRGRARPLGLRPAGGNTLAARQITTTAGHPRARYGGRRPDPRTDGSITHHAGCARVPRRSARTRMRSGRRRWP